MDDGLRRRAFVRAAGLGLLAGIAGCEAPRSSAPPGTDAGAGPTGTSTPAGAAASPPVAGTAVDLSGDPVTGASVRAIVPGEGPVAEAATDAAGRFGLDTGGRPAWLRVSADGFHDRTVAVAPDGRPTVELTASDGTVSLSFCGDVKFAGGFYGTDDDGRAPRVRISPSTRLADHREILRYVAPRLRSADVTSVNLETPLTTTAWRHPEKKYSFASHPVAARALAEAGVDYAALGNNHALDALVPGLEETTGTLDAAGLAHSGAGRSSEAAWRPALVERRGLTVGYLSCTTVVEPEHDIDLSADRGASETHTVTRETDDGRESITFSGDAGAAEATEERLARRVDAVADRADVTVVQVHGGGEFSRTPTARIRRLADAAGAAGADLVVCHHPHVTGGLEVRNGTLAAWSLGNFVFDHDRWPAFPSCVLTAHVGRDGVERAYLDPVLLEGYVPKGVVGKPRADQLWRTAGLSSGEFALEGHTLQYVRGREPATRTAERSFDGGLYAREAGWPRAVVEGADAVAFGRDRLPTGRFEDPDVDGERYEGPLWRFDRASAESGPGVGYEGGGVRLVRTGTDDGPAVLGPVERVRVLGPLTFAGRYRHGSGEGLAGRVSWYENHWGSPVAEEQFALGGTDGEWAWLREELAPPDGATHVDVSVRLAPPASGERAAAFDDLRLIEWADGATGGRAYDHLRVDGAATVEFAANAGRDGPDEIEWTEVGR